MVISVLRSAFGKETPLAPTLIDSDRTSATADCSDLSQCNDED